MPNFRYPNRKHIVKIIFASVIVYLLYIFLLFILIRNEQKAILKNDVVKLTKDYINSIVNRLLTKMIRVVLTISERSGTELLIQTLSTSSPSERSLGRF